MERVRNQTVVSNNREETTDREEPEFYIVERLYCYSEDCTGRSDIQNRFK